MSGGIVVTDAGTIAAAHVVLATGAWLPAMLPAAQRARFVVRRQVLHRFAVDEPELHAPGRCPVFIWMHGEDGATFYGFPKADGYDGVKIAPSPWSKAFAVIEQERNTVAAIRLPAAGTPP